MKKHQVFKRALACLMAVFILMTSVPLNNLTSFSEGILFNASAEDDKVQNKIITDYEAGDIIEFGYYPQSLVTDEELISVLDAIESDWVSYDYYVDEESSDFMKYKDVICDGNKYRAVTFTNFRTSYQCENGYSIGDVYWFKFEPLIWRVLDPSTGFVACSSIIDAQPYLNYYYIFKSGNLSYYYTDSTRKYYANNYSQSSIRSWLNSNFFFTAFSTEQQHSIARTTIFTPAVNSSSSKYDSPSTNDNIFLLSFSNVKSSSYGFNNNSDRVFFGTDYSKIQGLYVDPDSGKSNWRLRTAGDLNTNTCYVTYSGLPQSWANVLSITEGILPAFCFDLSSEIVQSKACYLGEHDLNYYESKQPTCECSGWDEYEKCTKCSYSTYKEIPAKGHDFIETEIDSHHTAENIFNFVCKDCNSIQCNIDGTSHLIANWEYKPSVVTKATCTEPEEILYTCSLCGLNYSEFTSELGHDYVKHASRKPNCYLTGWDEYETCSRCNYSTQKIIPATGHTYGEYIYKEATCTDDGYYYAECLDCGSTNIVDVSGSALGHDYIANEVAPTHLEDGYIIYTCSRCNDSYTEHADYLQAEGHTAAPAVIKNVVKATCTKDGLYNEVTYCAVCNEELSKVERTESKLGHSYGKYVFNNDATFTSDGTKTATCIRCGAKKTIKIEDYELKARCGETLAYKFKVESQELVIDGKGHFYKNGKTVLTNAENKRYKDKCSSINTSCDKTINSYSSRISQLESEGYFTGTYTEFRNAVNDLTTKISNLDRRIASIGWSSDPSDIAEKRRLESERNRYQSQLDELYKMYSNASQINAFREQIKFTERSRTNDLQKQEEVHSQNIAKISEYISAYGYSHSFVTNTTKATLTKNGSIVKKCTSKKCDYCKTTVIYYPKTFTFSSTPYNGKVQKPTLTVKDSNGNIISSKFYTITWSNSSSKNVGTYSAKLVFKRNYSGTKSLYYTILPGVTSKIATATNSSAVKIAWKAVPGATGYRVFQYNTKTKQYVTLKTTTGTSYTVTKLKSGTSYKFAVRAYTIVNGKVFWASGYKTVTATTNPGTPTLKVTAGTKKAALSWNKQTGATGYVVYMATSKNGKYSKIATLKGNSKVSYTKTGLTKGKTYYFKVAAYTVANGKMLYSSFSSVKAVKIK